MQGSVKGSPAWKSLRDKVARQLEFQVAQIVAPFFPERYYRRYRAALAEKLHALPVLDGLPEASEEEGLAPLYLSNPNNPAVRHKMWDAISGHALARILIVGSVGSGKSILLRSLVWEMASRSDETFRNFTNALSFRLFGQTVDEFMPVLVDLQVISQRKITLLDAMLDSLAHAGFPGAREFLLSRLQAGKCFILLDGLERIIDAADQAQIAQAINDYPQNIWIATTRPTRNPFALPGCASLLLCGISHEDIGPWLRHNLAERPASVGKLMAAFARSPSLTQLAETPLMLAAMARVFRQSSAREARLPVLLEACLVALENWATKARQPSRHDLQDKLRLASGIADTLQAQKRSTIGWGEMVAFLTAAGAAHAEEVAQDLTERMGLLIPSLANSADFRFSDPILQSYLAAHKIVTDQRADALLPLADDPWWRDTIILTASLLPNALAFLYNLENAAQREPDKWLLLANCIAEAEGCDDVLCDRVRDRLFALLENDAGDDWNRAIAAIAGTARKQVRDYLTTLARDPNVEMRRRAILTMGRLRQDWAIPILGGLVSDPAPQVRQQVAWALGYIPSVQSARVLVRSLRSSSAGVREASAKSLAMLGQTNDLRREVVRELIRALGDENSDVADVAETALIEIGRATMPELTIALNDQRLEKTPRSRVAKTLGRLGDEHAMPILLDALLNSPPEELEGYVEAMAGVGPAAVPTLIAALAGKDVTTGAGLVASLVKIGAPAVLPLIAAVAGDAPEVRNAAVRALEQIGEPAIEPLTYALLHDERYEVRRRALEVLGRIGASHAVEALINALNDSDEGVQINAVRHLGSFRDKRAVEPLIEVLNTREALNLRRAAILNLSEIGDVKAVPALIHSLDEPSLRDAASSALVHLGRDAIEPCIRLLHAPETSPEVDEIVWDVLAQIGIGARPEEESMVGLASTYARLHDKSLSPAEILALVDHLNWWEYGPEIHKSLETAHALAATRDLATISEQGERFDWLTERGEWLRPYVKEVLWRFKDVVENIKLYRSLTRRDSQRDALLSSIDRLEELQQLIQMAALPFERGFFDRVVAQWRALILDATKQLRGRASLTIELLTTRLPLRGAQHVTTAVFSIFNEGDSPARNLSVRLRPVGLLNGLQVVGADRTLDPLGIGERRQVEMSIAPNGLREAELVFEARYDDDERENVSDRYSCRIAFFDAPSVYTPIHESPYIVGMPVKTSEMFFGRQDIFDWVRENIASKTQERSLIIYGERRMGKTSVLYQLLQTPPTPHHICMLFDLQLYNYLSTIPEFLFELATQIWTRLTQAEIMLDEPNWDIYSANPHRAFRDFCDLLDRTLGEYRVLVMMDEFGVLMDKVRNKVFEASLFDYLRGLIQRSSTLSFLFTGAYEIRRMQQDYGSILFNMPKVLKISYLTTGEATELIQKPVEGLLSYHPLVINKIHEVTACHPYFVQYICDELVHLAQSERRNYVELTDLDYVIKNVVQDATGNIEHSIYDYLEHSEKLALAALANLTDEVRVFVPISDIAALLDRRHLGMSREEIANALKALEERDLVTEMRIGQQLRYAFRMGLVRTWLRQNAILLRLGQEQEG